MNTTTHSLRFNAMGCPCEVRLEGGDDARLRAAAATARAEVDRLDAKYSHYRDDSLVARIDAAAGGGVPLEVDAETADLLDFAAALHRQSSGRFDITAGALTTLWDLQSGCVPDAAAIDAARARCGWQHVAWERPHVYLSRPGMRIDFGGIVKEYAADRAAQACRDAGIAHGFVDLGGDIAVAGAHFDGTPWHAGIKTPRDPSRALATIPLMRGGLATSGDYERAMIVDGRRYSHIIDVRSGMPVESFASVSVLAESCLIAGAACTLAILFGVDEGREWLEQLGVPFLSVDADGRIGGTLAQTR